jgi:hypothetical protein
VSLQRKNIICSSLVCRLEDENIILRKARSSEVTWHVLGTLSNLVLPKKKVSAEKQLKKKKAAWSPIVEVFECNLRVF